MYFQANKVVFSKWISVLLFLPFLVGAGINNANAGTSQTITFTSTAPAYPVAGDTFTVTATASSGDPVIVAIDANSSSICSISGSIVTFNSLGNCVITASQVGGATYDPVSAQETVTVVAVPSAPTITSITGNAATASVNFTAGSNNGAAITNYQYSTDNGSNWITSSPSVTSSPLTITGLTAGTTYNIKLRAVNGAGVGNASTATSFTPTAATTVGANGDSISVAAGSTTNLNSVLAHPMVVSGFDSSLTLLATLTTSLGTLQETSTAVSTVTGYQSPVTNAASSIAFSGTQAQLNEALASVKLIAGATGGSATISVSISNRGTNSVAYNPDNGHYYQYVSTLLTWDAAYNAITGDNLTSPSTVANVGARQSQTASSCAYSFNGMCGYFATSNTSAENSFITSKVGSAQAWLGGSDRRSENSWKWDDPKAPEYDKQFSNDSTETSYTVGSTTYSFQKWNSSEPNNSGSNENALQILSGGTGFWNDLPENSSTMGYVVEYGGLGETVTYPTASRTISAAIAPSAPTFGSVTSTNGGFTVQISNFSGSSTYETTTVTVGSASISGSGLITVTGLNSNQSSTVTVRVTQGGQTNTASVTGTSNIVSTPCPTTYCVFDNGFLRFGSGSASSPTYTPNQNSVNASGLFEQPFYHSADGNWYKLTYSSYPLNLAIGSGSGNAGNWSGNTVSDYSAASMTGQVIDYSNYIVTSNSGSTWSKGYGKIVVKGIFDSKYEVTNVYELGQNDKFVKVTTTVKNVSASTLTNVNIWVGTQDDFVGNSDRPVKTRGNLDGPGGAFQAITNQTQQAKAIQITTASEGALFYSTSAGANTAYNSCCSFSNAYNQNPATSGTQSSAMDGSYAAILNVGDLATNASGEIVWFYAAGAIADLASVSQAVSAAAAPPAPSAPTAIPGDGSASLTWTAPTNTSSPIVNYQVQYSSDGGSTWTTVTRTQSSSTSWTVSPLTNGQAYIFKVAAVTSNDGGATTTVGDYGNVSNEIHIGSPDSSTATVPVSVNSDGVATVSFTPPTSPVVSAPVTSYQYRVRLDGGTWGNWETATATSSPIQIPGLTNGNLYNAEIRAVNDNGPGVIWDAFNILTYPAFNNNALATLVVGTSANITNITATTSITSGSYVVSAGALPAGLNLNPNTGAITGIPTESGSYDFTISATNASGTGSRRFTGTVQSAPVIATTTLATLTSGTAANLAAPITGGTSYSISAGTLPAGLTLNATTGAITGTPTGTGAYNFTITATNSYGSTSRAYTGTVNAAPSSGFTPPPVIWTAPTIAPVNASGPVNISLNVSGATTYSVLTGNLPPGLTINPTTGVISGTPTTPGTYTFQILANNVYNTGQAQSFTMVVNEAAPVTPTTPPTDNSNSGSGASGSGTGTGSGDSSGTGTSGSGSSTSTLPPLNPVVLTTPVVTGNAVVTLNGQNSVANLKPNNTSTGLIMTATDFSLALNAQDTSGKTVALAPNQSLVVQENHYVSTQGSGFLPNSTINIYLFSEPKLLGTTKTNDKGEFSVKLPLNSLVGAGSHTLQVVGYAPDNKVRAASIPLQVIKAPATPVVKPQSAGVITFTKGSFEITNQAKSVIKNLNLSKVKSVIVYGFASNSRISDDLRISLDRAIEVKKVLQKLYPKLQIKALGQGTKKIAACKPYNNLCAVVTAK